MSPTASAAAAGRARAIRAMPKADLHVHLEGTAGPASLRALLADLGDPAPAAVPAAPRRRDLAAFLDRFRRVLDLLRTPAAYAALAAGYLERAGAHGARRVEFSLSLGSALRRAHDPRALLRAVGGALRSRPGTTGALIVDVVRQFGPDEAERALDAALENLDPGVVVGFGMGGDERAVPARAFRGVFRRARAAGLRTTVHAGEAGTADAVREALDELAPDRIAHGIAAAGDPRLLRRLADERIPLDVCLTSNLRTGAVRSLAEHPLPRLLGAGVRVTLGTDDPGLFATHLTREYLLAGRIARLDLEGLRRLANDSLEAAFLPK